MFCESEDIWKVPPKAVETPAQLGAGAQKNLDVSQHPPMQLTLVADDSESGNSTGAELRNTRTRRGAIQTMYAQSSDFLLSISFPPDMVSVDSPLLQDDTSASGVSFHDELNNEDKTYPQAFSSIVFLCRISGDAINVLQAIPLYSLPRRTLVWLLR